MDSGDPFLENVEALVCATSAEDDESSVGETELVEAKPIMQFL